MFTFRKNAFVYGAIVTVFLILFAGFVPFLRFALLPIFKFPLVALTVVSHEAEGIIYYHRNMVLADALLRQNDILRAKLAGSEELALENERLAKLLAFKEKTALRVVAAKVIGVSADTWSSAVIIDKGRANGIRRGQAVMTFLGLAGRVAEVEANTAKVFLLNDPNISVSAIVQRSRQEGLVSGTLGSSLVMKYLPKDADIAAGDVVVSSGLTALYPKGILIGTVSSVLDEFSGLSRYAVVKPAVNLSNLEELLVVIP